MPSASKTSTRVAVDLDVIQGRYASLGSYTVAFESFKQDDNVYLAPFFVGLPDDRCQCQYWGLVTERQIIFRWPDREETYVSGDAYYAPPGHLPLITAGTSIVEFSPTDDLDDPRTPRRVDPRLPVQRCDPVMRRLVRRDKRCRSRKWILGSPSGCSSRSGQRRRQRQWQGEPRLRLAAHRPRSTPWPAGRWPHL
jgi:hypothetical protein